MGFVEPPGSSAGIASAAGSGRPRATATSWCSVHEVEWSLRPRQNGANRRSIWLNEYAPSAPSTARRRDLPSTAAQPACCNLQCQCRRPASRDSRHPRSLPSCFVHARATASPARARAVAPPALLLSPVAAPGRWHLFPCRSPAPAGWKDRTVRPARAGRSAVTSHPAVRPDAPACRGLIAAGSRSVRRERAAGATAGAAPWSTCCPYYRCMRELRDVQGTGAFTPNGSWPSREAIR